jgi:succinyl-diaminopimelate desuccinylase
LGELLAIVEAYEARRPVVEGCEYREALQAVHVEGGVAGNVVPDSAMVRINHRFAPDRSSEEAVAHVRSVLAPALEDGDTVEVTDLSPAARPGLGDPLIEALVERNGLEVRAKLGWTDVAFFAERGVPASNFGPGDATIAHTQGEYVERAWVVDTHAALLDVITNGV